MKRVMLSLGVVGMLVCAGCRSTCCRDNPPPKPVIVPGPPSAPVLQQQQFQQPGGFPVLPPTQPPGPPPSQPPAPPPAPSISKTPQRNDTQWQQRETPESEQRRDAPPRIQLYAPEPIDKDAVRQTEEPPVKKPSAEGSVPAIPQFAVAKENVFAGLRPSLDGLDWLRKKGVQTVVQVRLFGEDDSAVRKEVEARSMRYVAFEISPLTLTQEKADEFVKLIREGARTGIFVFDTDGALAGSLWYLYFRQGETLDDDPSQLRARGLGLQADRDGMHRDMWLAVQKLLSENSK